ncbi:hypothetical protein RHMOL_Rhmol13G0225900 [Rhododendron molle]|uniref:Uncharacterized protein n=1 Tax=Rhododendron molle TaxID=49168 RepID=A0ACC0LAV5_RHOML|nr:hypothetical protein RHMOL_Rhmol13G0225900 [Rhododendron molle]
MCRCSNINKFVLHLSCDKGESFPPDVNRWICFATQNNVEDLDLKFGSHAGGYSLPRHLFTNSSLRILSASGCDIEISPSVQSSWISLKSLTFDSVWLRDGAIAKILSGCLVLEIFNMKRVNAFGPLDINSASLKKLVMEQCVIGDGEDVLKIQLLIFSWHFREISCIVLSVGDVRGLPSPMSSCKMLTLHTHVTKWDVPGIASVLQSSPYIEKLVVDLSSPYHEFIFCKKFLDSCNSDGEDPWTSHKSSFFQLMHLKTAEIVSFKTLKAKKRKRRKKRKRKRRKGRKKRKRGRGRKKRKGRKKRTGRKKRKRAR